MSRRCRDHCRFALLALLCASAMASALGCQAEPSPDDWLSQLEQAHRAADEALDGGHVEAAREALLAVIDGPMPSGLGQRDGHIILQDVYHRLAEIELLAGRAEAALDWCDRGLELEQASDLFVANLLVSRGRANEALGRDEAAAADYFAALEINEALLQEHLRAAPSEE